MGVRLSLLAPQAQTVALRSYIDVLPGYVFLEVINDSRFLKTVKAYDTNSKVPVIIKVFIKPTLVSIKLSDTIDVLQQESTKLGTYQNVLPYFKLIDTDLAGYMVRQLIRSNLFDRLSLRPFLCPIEKLWFVFQLLKAIDLLHNDLHVCHGDIKTENILVTSSDWLLLTDFSNNIKPTFLPDDNPSEFVFYFDSSNRRSCYLAPERFYEKGSPPDKNKKLTAAMDLFSLGCVIAELYLDGEPTFTLSDLFKFKKDERFEPNLSSIPNYEVRSVVVKLLSRNPNHRPGASEILRDLRGLVFPEHFYEFLHPFMTVINDTDSFVPTDDYLSSSDLRLEKIYTSFDKIITDLDLRYENKPTTDDQPEFPYINLNLKGLPKNYQVRGTRTPSSDTENKSALLILNLICSLVGSLRQPESKVKACELILALSEKVDDEAKLDRALPFLFHLLEDYVEHASFASTRQFLNPDTQGNGASIQSNAGFTENTSLSTRVACTALLCATNILETCTSINAINANVFPEYILPSLRNLGYLSSPYADEISYIRSTLATCLPYLARIADRFYTLSRGFQAPETGGNLALNQEELENQNPRNGFKASLFHGFKDLTEALLTDQSLGPRMCLIQHILPLCHFFGADKTNDLILPHLLTYLNDSSYQLRLAFLSAVLKIGPFIGALSFEQYLSPLLFQALGDHEPLVVLKVLQILYVFLDTKLINRSDKFNVLSVYREVLVSCVTLLLQPNEWIRQSVLNIIIVIAEDLLEANKFCFLYPIIKSYLSYDVSSFTWDSLYPCITKPLSPQTYNLALVWSSNATNKSYFWNQKSISAISQANGRKKHISFNKNMGKSVFIPQSGSSNTVGIEKESADIPMSSEDRQWILKLRSLGLEERDLWKVFALKSHFLSYNRSKQSSDSLNNTEFELAENMNLPPSTIFFDVCYKSEDINGIYKKTDQSGGPDSLEALSNRSKGDLNSLILPGKSKAKASTQTVEANVMGELETTVNGAPDKSHHHHPHPTGGDKSTSHRVFSVSELKIISASMRHNYEGPNPFIKYYLQTISFSPTVDDFPEFGPVIKGSQESTSLPVEFSKKDLLVAQINSNSETHKLDAVTKIAVAPTSEFFVTGSKAGKIKVWDTSKLDLNTMARNPSLSIEMGAAVTDIVFMPHRFVFAVLTGDGRVTVFRVQLTRNKSHRIIKYVKLISLRHAQLEEGVALLLDFVTINSTTMLLAATSACQILCYDCITMAVKFQLQNPLAFGQLTSFVVSKSHDWLLAGSSEGVLTLWDIRFEIRLKSWRMELDGAEPMKSPIRKIMLVPPPSRHSTEKRSSVNAYVAIIGGAGQPDITIWEVPGFKCCQIYTANETSPKIKSYTLKECEPLQELKIEDMLRAFSFNSDTVDKSFRCLTYVGRDGASPNREGYFVLVTDDSRCILWDLQDISESKLYQTEQETTFTKSAVSLELEISYEKMVSGTHRSHAHSSGGRHDAVKDVGVLFKSSYMLVTAERNGTLNVYR